MAQDLTPEALAPRIDAARRAGFSDDDILKELSTQLPTIRDALKQGYNPKQILDELSPKRYVTPGEVATGAIQNFPGSFGNLVKGIYDAITSPLETAKSLLDVGAGTLQNVLPERFVQFVGEDPQSRDAARKVGQFFADRYGTAENLKQTIAKDPAGVLADLSTILTGGSMAAPRAVAPMLAKTASVVDPLALTVRGLGATANVGGRVASELLGVTTGTGREPIALAFKAAREGGDVAEVFRQNLRKKNAITDVLQEAKSALDQLKLDRQNQYRSGMVNIKNDKSILDFNGIDTALKNAQDKVAFKGKIKNQSAFDALEEVRLKVEDWKKSNPADFHTPEGMDALKQSIGEVLEKLEPGKAPYTMVNEVYNSVKSEIVKQAPTYANVMSTYAKATDQIMEVQKTLGLKNTTTADNALRKLLSTLRDNVNANFGQRLELLKELDKQGTIVPALAGQSLSQWTPRGLQRFSAGPSAVGLGVFVDPFAAGASLASSSPRMVGEAANIAGRAAGAIDQLRQNVPLLVNPQLYNYLYQSGNIQGLLE